MSKLEEMRKALADRKRGGFVQDNALFPQWQMELNGVSSIRLFNYLDHITSGFWSEKKMIPMKFLNPENPAEEFQYRAPCVEMYSQTEKCTVLKHVRAVYAEEKAATKNGNKSEADRFKSVANAHWLKNTFYYQGMIRSTKVVEENLPENPIRIFAFGKQLQKWINTTLFENTADPFERLPCGEATEETIKKLVAQELSEEEFTQFETDMLGRSLLLKKTKQGDHNNWVNGTTWHSKWEGLTDAEIEAIAKFGLHDLRKRLPERPTPEQYAVMEEMIKVSLGRLLGTDEGLWNPEWEDAGIKPFKARSGGDGEAEEAAIPAESPTTSRIALGRGAKVEPKTEAPAEAPAETAVENAVAETVETTPTSDSPKQKSANDVIARMKARKTSASAA